MVEKCKKGEIWRVRHTRKSSKKKGSKKRTSVKGKCIKATSQTGKKTSVIMKKKMSKRRSIHKLAREKFGSPICSSGEIMREGFSRKKHGKTEWIPPTCVADVGKEGHGEQLFTIEPDRLTKYGYVGLEGKSDRARHTSLNEAISSGEKPLSVMRRLVALSTVNKNTHPRLSNILKSDAMWIKETHV